MAKKNEQKLVHPSHKSAEFSLHSFFGGFDASGVFLEKVHDLNMKEAELRASKTKQK